MNELRVLEAGANHVPDPTPTASFYTGIGSHAQQGRYNQNRVCVFCKGPHPNKCAIVVDPTTRNSIISKGYLCFHLHIALLNALQSIDVGIAVVAKHHTTICEHDNCPTTPPNLPTLPPTPPTLPAFPPSGNGNPPSQTQSTRQSVLATLTPAQRTLQNHPTLLKTAVSLVKVGPSSRYAKILFDEGAQRSIITRELANELGGLNRTAQKTFHCLPLRQRHKQLGN